jgi:hypothetical protein
MRTSWTKPILIQRGSVGAARSVPSNEEPGALEQELGARRALLNANFERGRRRDEPVDLDLDLGRALIALARSNRESP